MWSMFDLWDYVHQFGHSHTFIILRILCLLACLHACAKVVIQSAYGVKHKTNS